VSSAGVDFGAVLDYARETGGPALRAITFGQRGQFLKAGGS
jgi:oxepin-CoA hydrolase/3-oxo-5,6-dehydrosuberyl-CoA semialdehyde dehydrogenase